LEIKIIETLQELGEIEPLWKAFARENTPHLCNSYFWQIAALNNYFNDAPIKVFLFYEGNELTGVLPMCFNRSSFVKFPVKKYHFFEQGIGLTTLMFKSSCLLECFRRLWENLPVFLAEFDVLKLTLEQNHKEILLPFFRKIRQEGFTILFAEKQALALQSISQKNYFENIFNGRQRRDHKRLMKKMERDYQIQTERISREDLFNKFDLYWHRFLSLYQKSWKHDSQRSLSSLTAETGFFYSLFQHYAAQQLAYLSFLRLDNNDVAAVWIVQHLKTWYGLQTVYDATFKQYSPGIYLIQESIFSLIQNDSAKIDFMGSQRYKKKFSNLESTYYDFYILTNRLYGKVLKKLSAKSKMDFQTI
jgi:CelD/BcsL family acetyltransferase involved in cellulose biosynthesis